MKKTININLGNHPFTADEDAYLALDQYLNAVERQFSTSEGCDEIMQDIEIRIAELLNDRLGSRRIINMMDYEHIITVMGSPNQFADDNVEDEYYQEPTYSTQSRKKRLFRSADDKVIGGICAGLAQYLGIHDPVIMRVLFVILAFPMGVGPLFYLVLWVAIPEAKTAADRLAMKGEKIDINNIAKSVEQEIKDISSKVKKFSDGFKTKA